MKRSRFLIFLALAGCTTTTEISPSSEFRSVLAVPLESKRITFIYNFNKNSVYELWDHIYEYYQSDGQHIVKPIDTCPAGSIIKIANIYKEHRFDNPETIKAKGNIKCGSQSYEITYIWGLGNEIHAALWESEKYEPRVTRAIGQP